MSDVAGRVALGPPSDCPPSQHPCGSRQRSSRLCSGRKLAVPRHGCVETHTVGTVWLLCPSRVRYHPTCPGVPSVPANSQQIDGAAQRGLMSRFQLRAYHGVYYLNGTETRAFCEGRDGNACEGKHISHQKVGGHLGSTKSSHC